MFCLFVCLFAPLCDTAVTSMYTAKEEPLVSSIRAAVEANATLEGSFSRKRSFRLKLKKEQQRQDDT